MDIVKRGEKRKIRDGIEIIHRMFFEGHPERIAQLYEVQADDEVGRCAYRMRTGAGLTPRQMAKLVNTTASVICRLEDADYEGHSLAMLNRIAAALNKRVKIEFVPLNKRRRSA
jgi:hypothetical protein